MRFAVDRLCALVFGAISAHHLLLLSLTILHQSPDNLQVQAQRIFNCITNNAWCTAYGHCPEFSCRGKNKVTLRNVTQCGCCNRCIEEKGEGEECPTDITGNLPGNQCGPHLKCEKSGRYGKCVKINSDCEKERADFEHSSSQLITSKAQPDCDEFGEYIPRRCKNGTICQCVDERGVEIFGLAPYNQAKEMNCLCSRQFELVKRKLMEVHSKPIEPINFMRCKENGNYESYQTHLQYSYCVHPSNGTMWDRPVMRASEKDLPCVNDRYTFKTECIKKYNEAMKAITEKEKEYRVIGFDVPRCDLDGSYGPVQCLNDKCFCVDREGKKLKGPNNKVLEVERSNPFAKVQTCSCARHMEMIRAIKPRYRNKVTELFSRYQCDINGNYLPIQCSDSACYCVDPLTGYADHSDRMDEGSSALKSEPDKIRQLFCYKRYPEKEKQRLRDLLRLPVEDPTNQVFM